MPAKKQERADRRSRHRFSVGGDQDGEQHPDAGPREQIRQMVQRRRLPAAVHRNGVQIFGQEAEQGAKQQAEPRVGLPEGVAD